MLIATVLVILLALFLVVPFRLGAKLRLVDMRMDLRVVISVAGSPEWLIRVPTSLAKLSGRGVRVGARGRFYPFAGRLRLKETITPEKISEEARVPESMLHMALVVVDVIQFIMGLGSLEDGRGRSLGSPLLHLVAGPFTLARQHLCRMDFSWQTRIGVGDASSTAMGVGLLWCVKASLVALMEERLILVRRPTIDVTPRFDSLGWVSELTCIFHLSLGQIMWRALRDAAQRWQRKGAGVYGR